PIVGFAKQRARPDLLRAFARMIHYPRLQVGRVRWIAGTRIKRRLKTFGKNPVLIINQITSILRVQRVALEQIPVNDIAVAVVVASSVNAWADLPSPRSRQPQIVNQVIQILMIHRISQRRRQHGGRSRRPAENPATVTPAFDRLKSLRPVNHHVRALPAEPKSKNGCDEERGEY